MHNWGKEESMLERTEMGMLRWMTGVSLRDKIKSEENRRRCGVRRISEKPEEQE